MMQRLMFSEKNPLEIAPIQQNGGYFSVFDSHTGELLWRRKNTIVKWGATELLKQVFQGASDLPATYYLGLTNAGYTFDDATLAAAAGGEPVGNGYARQPLVQDPANWTVAEINGYMVATSAQVVFSCTGSPWTKTWNRMFLCNALAGTVGDVFSYSGPRTSPSQVNVGLGPTCVYEFWLRG